MNIKSQLDLKTVQLMDIESIESIELKNSVDITVEDDESFILSNGIISHNSAQKSIQEARGKNPYIGSFALKGKPLNITDCSTTDILDNKEIKNIMLITGLKIGHSLERLDDEEWIEIEIDGLIQLANLADNILIDGVWTPVKSLLK